MKNAVFWDVAPCRSCVNRLQTSATCSRWFLASVFTTPEEGGDTYSPNVGTHKNTAAPHPRRLHSL
jgi:hypothetical protein